ncbi:MAG: DNA/RNA non-specific endonuclease [Bacteroidales bacterium]|nr:DNA/RNA non-specific endonuclease [Bacteroidales bacterium]
MKVSIIKILSAALIVMCSCRSASSQQEQSTGYELPAITESDIVATHVGYTVSYDCQHLVAKWVAYELTKDETYGKVPRQGNDFWDRDPDLNCRQAHFKDYSGTEWDRGHLAPAADMKWSVDAMRQSFLLTNCCPQNRQFNANSWESTERMGRRLAQQYGRVWIVCGPVFYDNKFGTIGLNKVAVPDAFFKAFLVEKDGSYGAMGLIMYNISGQQDIKECSMSVDELEATIGIDLFPALPDEVEEAVEAKIESKWWGI